MADFMNEQEQVELIKNFWKRYGNWVLGLFVIIAFGLSGYQYWQHRQEQSLNQASEMYLSLVNSANQKDTKNKRGDCTDSICFVNLKKSPKKSPNKISKENQNLRE